MKALYWLMYVVCILAIVTFVTTSNYQAAIWAFNAGIWVLSSHTWYNCAETWRNRCLNKDKEG